MNRKSLVKIIVTTYFVLLAGLALLSIYMGCVEQNQVYNGRKFGGVCTIQPETEAVQDDAAAPVGVRREFTWTMPDTDTNENCLAIYLVHHYAQIWFDDELVYSLTPASDGYIGDSPGSCWVILSVRPADSGCSVRVLLTPTYKSVAGRKIDFLLGPRYNILTGQLKNDLPQLVLSALCIAAGILLILAQFLLSVRNKKSDWELFYLGIFTLLIGIWRITDTRFSAILFANNLRLMGAVTISALFLATTPIPLYLRTRYRDSEKPLLIVALITCLATAAALVCQALNVSDLRETLFVCHLSLILVMIAALHACLRPVRRGADRPDSRSFILVLAAGALLDLVVFYLTGSSSRVLFTVMALLVFAVSRLVSGALISTRKAYTDSQTGLFNKNRWDELMRLEWKQADPIGIIMLDLNQLKQINDTMGHAAGDKVIRSFANILRNTIPSTNTICRWGGDEFTVMVTNASAEKMEHFVAAVAKAARQYNESGELPKIHFAAGWALSSEFPDLTPGELLEEADNRMYQDKKRWYAARSRGD